MKTSALRWIGLALAIVAAYLSNGLLGMHAEGSSDLGFLARNCEKLGGGCNKVVGSRWGVFPPGPAVEKTEESAENSATNGRGSEAKPTPSRSGIPVAALGLFYYLFLAVYFGLIGRPSWPVRKLHTAIIGINVLGILGSLIYISVMLFAIGESCPYCFGTHICNFLLFPILWKTRPKEPKFPEEGGGLVKPVLPFPDVRLAVTSLLLVLALCAATWNSYRAKSGGLQAGQVAEMQTSLDAMNREMEQMATMKSDYERLKAQLAALSKKELDFEELNRQLEELSSISEDLDKLLALHLGQEQVELGIRDDDAKILATPMANGRTGARMQLAVFNDVECPNCARFHDFLMEELLPLFNGHLEVVLKHYPNQQLHPNSLRAATALEAARMQGNEKFFEMHEYLHARRETLAQVDYRQAAISIGLDPEKFLRDMASPQAKKRVTEDMQSAFKAGVKGTPAVFLNRRPVDRLFRRNIGWWKLRADSLRAAREGRKQPW